MKRFSIIALAAIFAIAMGAGTAFAQINYNVTAGFGKEVAQDGLSELVGSITFAPTDLPAAYNLDTWFGVPTDPQIIRANILAGATISRTFGAAYRWDGVTLQPILVGVYQPNSFNHIPTDASELRTYPWEDNIPADDFQTGVPFTVVSPIADHADYIVVAYQGMSHFRVYVLNTDKSGLYAHRPAFAAGDHPNVRINHDQASALCFKLLGSQYKANDLVFEMVQVSYVDEYLNPNPPPTHLKNTFSGDQYVATVRAIPTLFDLCSKAIPTHTIGAGLCTTGQDECGLCQDSDCIFQFWPNDTFVTGNYRMVFGKTTGAKLGVGFKAIEILHSVAGPVAYIETTAQGVVSRRDRNGAATTLFSRTSEITVDVMLGQSTGHYQVIAHYEYDTCVPVTSGMWTIDFYAYRLPCGHSFGFNDRDVVRFVDPLGSPTCLAFPYAAASMDGRWHNGIALTNPMDIPLTVSIRLVEADGDVYLATLTIPANQMKVGLVGDLLEPTLASGHTDAEFGDEAYAIYVTSDMGLVHGYMFITNGHVAQGYTPLCCTGNTCN